MMSLSLKHNDEPVAPHAARACSVYQALAHGRSMFQARRYLLKDNK
jgi:hypothetical protein